MNCYIEIIDASTGEILEHCFIKRAFNYDPHDVGYKDLNRFCVYAIQKTRSTGVPFQVRFFFSDKSVNDSLPFQTSLNFDNPYDIKKF